MLLYGSNGLKFAGASRHSTLGCSRLTLEEQKLIGGGGNNGGRGCCTETGLRRRGGDERRHASQAVHIEAAIGQQGQFLRGWQCRLSPSAGGGHDVGVGGGGGLLRVVWPGDADAEL